jgi:hypothetical protein
MSRLPLGGRREGCPVPPLPRREVERTLRKEGGKLLRESPQGQESVSPGLPRCPRLPQHPTSEAEQQLAHALWGLGRRAERWRR